MSMIAPAMKAFSAMFPEVGPKETRVVVVPKGTPLPAGRYAFLEFYCPDPKCDCRRVIFRVLEESNPAKVMATIYYGWEKPIFYTKWVGIFDGFDDKGPGLEPLGNQSEHADLLLEVFEGVVLKDSAYVERLQRHYWMVKREARLKASGIGTGKKKKKR